MDNYIKKFVNNCTDCNKNRPRLKNSTDKRKECGLWERIHMERLYQLKCRNVLVIAVAGSSWLEIFPCTDKSTRNVVGCLRKIFSRFGVPYTVVSGNRKELVSKDLIKWLTAQCSYKSDTLFHSPRSNSLAERAVEILKCSLKLFNKNIGYSLGTNIDEILFSHRNFWSARGNIQAELLLRRNLGNPILRFYDVGQKIMYKPTFNQELRELT